MAGDLDLLCFSLNVRGIRSQTKRKALFKLFKERMYDIVCLQETHVTKDVTDQWKKEWGGELVYSEFSEHGAGQVVLFRKKHN